MIPRSVVGKGVTGLSRYVLGEGRGAGNDNLAPGEQSRVAWIGGQGFGFPIDSRERAELATRIMEFDALNQTSRTRRCEKDAVHLALAWRVGEQPSREEMEDAARSALAALGMENAKAIWAAHRDESHAHLHIVASKIDPDTGRAYDLRGDYLKLSRWAQRYEREHGGVVCLRREEANALRDAIEKRDAGAVLEAMTRQRATFTGGDLSRALGKQIRGELERAQFGNAVLDRPEVVRLTDDPGGRTSRYTTRAVLESEQRVLTAAAALKRDDRHAAGARARRSVLGNERFATMREDQRRAFERTTGSAGLALIDGQAGTGKSYTMAAIREAYEASGDRVIGLAPTNAVAQDMARDGFAHASTVHSELFALNNGRRQWDRQTIVMVDEAAMIDTRLMAEVTAHARDAGAKLILVGDDRQLASIDRGGMFGALKDRYGAAALTQVTRQHQHDDRRAASMLAEGNFAEGLAIYEEKGGISWSRSQDEARAALVVRWAADSAAAPGKSRFVFAYTNADVAALNADLRAVRQRRGELGEDHRLPTADGLQAFAAGDRVQFTGTDKKLGVYSGAAGTVLSIDGTQLAVQLDGRQGRRVALDAAEFGSFRHGYAGTIYKGQGRTLDETYLYHSEHWRSAASYVALTRHREKTELFVATNTARDLAELARQMARVDERRAASQFHPQPWHPHGAAHPLTGYEGAAERRGAVSTPEEDSDFQLQQEKQRLGTIEDQKDRADEFLRQQQTAQEQAETERRGREAATAARAREGDITDAEARYAQAAGDYYDIRDPYRSLVRVVTAEHAAYREGQDALKRQEADERDPEKRKLFELRREIEHADYMALTSERLAGMSYVITGRRGEGTQHEKDTEAAREWRTRGADLRDERRDLQREMQQGRDAAPRPDEHSAPERDPRRDAEARAAEPERGDELRDAQAEVTDAKAAKRAQARENYERSQEANRSGPDRSRPRGGLSR